MAIVSNFEDDGVLSTSPVTLRTGIEDTETHFFTFYNTDSGAVIVSFYLQGNLRANVELDADGGYCTVKLRMGAGNTFGAKADTNSVVEWTDEMDIIA